MVGSLLFVGLRRAGAAHGQGLRRLMSDSEPVGQMRGQTQDPARATPRDGIRLLRLAQLGNERFNSLLERIGRVRELKRCRVPPNTHHLDGDLREYQLIEQESYAEPRPRLKRWRRLCDLEATGRKIAKLADSFFTPGRPDDTSTNSSACEATPTYYRAI